MNVWISIKQAPWYRALEDPRKALSSWKLPEKKEKEIDKWDKIFHSPLDEENDK